LPEPPPSREVRRIRSPLLRWYRRERRDLPWRRTNDPYAIWVSEVMLQQTQVATVIPYYERFLERFPDTRSLAVADEEEVLAAWSGLGYYRRARGLHSGARVVVERHDGKLPMTSEALQSIPGIGRYTAGAIASIAFDRAEPILDGNVRRVLSRLFALDASGVTRNAEDRWLWTIASELVRGRAPGDFNQALMELGAQVCTPRQPRCESCPVARWCHGRLTDRPDAFPVVRAARATETVRVAVAWISRSGRILVERPGPDSPFRGTWDLPAITLAEQDDAVNSLASALDARHDLRVNPTTTLARATHGILHRRLKLEAIDCRYLAGRVSGRDDLRWLGIEDLARAAVSGATPKIARAVAARASEARPRIARRTRRSTPTHR